LAVAAPITQAVRYAAISRDTMSEIFVATSTAAPSVRPAAAEVDPWAGTARVSVLLIGSDAGADRIGIRTDSMMVASIDTNGGATVLVGVPRNIQNFDFPEDNPLSKVWPNGYNCGSECILTNAWMEAVNHKDLFPGDPNPGLTTTRGLVSEILGISIDYTAVIDLRGFQDLVDAMGGVTIDIPKAVPIYGQGDVNPPISEWIKAGQNQHLDGYHALWYARSRKYDDDFHRMKRQRCVVGALVSEVDPVAMLSRYPAMARAIQKHVRVDIPLADLPAWATLVERIQKGGMRSLALTPENISTVHPDLDSIHALVGKALTPSRQPTPASTSTSTKKPAKTSTATPSANPTTAVDLDEAC
ncbi:MAG TPA: LCP family protein, partial [Candidatus Lustribacter sp.]|nr:LCP family protein [Candidatus Lustribacter sp.]